MAIRKNNHLLPADVWIVAHNLNSHINAVKEQNKIKRVKRGHHGSWLEYKVALEEWQLKVQRAKKALEVRHAYIKMLRNLGWTLESIGEAFGITRERTRQLASKDCPIVISSLDIPLPMPPQKPEKFGRVIRVPDEETIARLRELHSKARLVRSSDPRYRKEAEEFTYLLNHLVNVEKYTAYQIAKILGVTHAALEHRLVRYGYKTTNGTSQALVPLKHRIPLH